MGVEVVTPEEYMGDIIGDLNSRRGQIPGMEPAANAQVISAMVPLATMFGYVNTLRSMSQGRATYTMHVRPLRAGAPDGRPRKSRRSRPEDAAEPRAKRRTKTDGEGEV